jgi:hypothetical protein
MSLPSSNKVLARLRRAGHEDSVLDWVSPPLRGWASDFSLRGQRKVTKRKATPTCSPSCVGFPRLRQKVWRNDADGTSLYRLRLRRRP